MLCEGHGIVFIASPFLLNTSPALKADSVRMISFNEDSQADYLERAAIRESGITCIITQKPGSGIVHIAGDMRYSVTDKAFLDGIGRPLTVGAEGADLVYMTAGDLADASVTNLVFAASSVSGGEIVVNNAPVKDINRGVFINSFYAGLSKGDSPAGAFRAASDKLRNGRFRHPSNWMGIRIYMRSLQ